MSKHEANFGRTITKEIQERDPRRLEIVELGSNMGTFRRIQNIDRASVAVELGVSEEELRQLELGQSADDDDLQSLLTNYRSWILKFPTS